MLYFFEILKEINKRYYDKDVEIWKFILVVFWFEFFWIGVYVISGIYEIFVINIGFIFIFFVSILWFINKC